MIPEIEWKEEYKLGHPEVDAQHEGLFKSANHILTAEKEDLPEYIETLQRYIQVHFCCEEQYLEEQGYAEVDYHKELHQVLINSLAFEVHKGFRSELDLQRFKIFFQHWVVGHILCEDVRYIERLNQKAS